MRIDISIVGFDSVEIHQVEINAAYDQCSRRKSSLTSCGCAVSRPAG
jgi:hypothetical protein